ISSITQLLRSCRRASRLSERSTRRLSCSRYWIISPQESCEKLSEKTRHPISEARASVRRRGPNLDGNLAALPPTRSAVSRIWRPLILLLRLALLSAVWRFADDFMWRVEAVVLTIVTRWLSAILSFEKAVRPMNSAPDRSRFHFVRATRAADGMRGDSQRLARRP